MDVCLYLHAHADGCYKLMLMRVMLDVLLFALVLEHRRALAHATGVIASVKYLSIATSQ